MTATDPVICDADMAGEMVGFTTNQILAQANTAPRQTLPLFRG